MQESKEKLEERVLADEKKYKTVSRDLAKKLKYERYPQKGILQWTWFGGNYYEVQLNYEGSLAMLDLIAVTDAELGEALPYRVRLESADYWLHIVKLKNCWDIRYKSFSEGRYHSMGLPNKGIYQEEILANAMAQMWLHLAPKGLVEIVKL